MLNASTLNSLLITGRKTANPELVEKVKAGCYAIMEMKSKANPPQKFTLSAIAQEFVAKNKDLVKTSEPYKTVWAILKRELKKDFPGVFDNAETPVKS